MTVYAVTNVSAYHLSFPDFEIEVGQTLSKENLHPKVLDAFTQGLLLVQPSPFATSPSLTQEELSQMLSAFSVGASNTPPIVLLRQGDQWVQANLSQIGNLLPATPIIVEDISDLTYTFIAADLDKVKRFTNAAGCEVTIPTGLGYGWNCLWHRSPSAGNLTFVAGGTTLIVTDGAESLIASLGTFGAIVPSSEADDTYLISGLLGS